MRSQDDTDKHEHEGGDGEVQPAEPKCGKSDDERGDRSGRAAGEQREVEIEVPLGGALAGDGRADGDESHLPERDLAGPAGQDDERQADDGVHPDGGRLDDLIAAQQQGDRRDSGEDEYADADAHQTDERQASHPRRERTDLVTEPPRRGFVGVGPAVLATLQQQCDEHRGPDDRRDEERAAGVPGDAVFEDAEGDGGGHELGVTYMDMPLSPMRIWEAIQEAKS